MGCSNPKTIAWLVQPCVAGESVKISWTVAYTVLWSNTGNLTHGTHVPTHGSVNVNPFEGDIETFGKNAQGYSFLGLFPSRSNPCSVGIKTDNTVVTGQVSVGLGIDGHPVLMCPAQPNLNITFTPRPKYYLAFGQYTQSSIVDVNKMSSYIELDYASSDTFSFTATIDASNQWRLTTNVDIT